MSTVLRTPPVADEQPVIAYTQQPAGGAGERPLAMLVYLLLGIGLGIVFVKSQVISWFRIQEMFRFQSFHMYGIIGSAIAVGAASVWFIRRYQMRAWGGAPIVIPPKEQTPWLRRYWIGGTIFGFGWALLGACPGPIFALIGSGATVLLVALASALAGTWVYAWLRPHLPH
ncbi:MAG: DUF6691 family protein [Longimicrobiales bacterium]